MMGPKTPGPFLGCDHCCAEDNLAIMEIMEITERLTRNPTPPLPDRNPNHRYTYWKFPVPATHSTSDLVPKPLFSGKSRLPPTTIHVEVHNIRDWSPRPLSSHKSLPSSPTASFQSCDPHAPAAANASRLNPLSGRSIARGYSFPSTDVCDWGSESEPLPAPKRSLKRKKRPKQETLRGLFEKESDSCCQKAYEQQLDMYLIPTTGKDGKTTWVVSWNISSAGKRKDSGYYNVENDTWSADND